MSKSPDANVSHFYYNTDLTVDQPVDLPDGSFFKSRRSKDEDVQIVNGQLTVVATDVTTISQTKAKTDYSYDYTDMKKEVQKYAKKCKDLGVNLNGEVLVFDEGNNKYFRLRVVNNAVEVEGAVLGWPSGGTAPLHADW
jgi:hypothetical protein